MNCRNCGFPLEITDRFCKNCGTPVEQINTQPTWNTPAQEPVVQQPVQTPPIMNEPMQQMNTQPTWSTPAQEPVVQQPVQTPPMVDEPAQTSGNQPFDNIPTKKADPVGVIIIILLLIGLLVGGYFGVKYVLKNYKNFSFFGKKIGEKEEEQVEIETFDVEVGEYIFKVPEKYEELIEVDNEDNSISIINEDNFNIYMTIADKADLNNEEDRSAAEMLLSFSLIMADNIKLEEENKLFGKDMIKASAEINTEDVNMDVIAAFVPFNLDNSVLILVSSVNNVDKLFDETTGMIKHLFE